GSVTSSDSHAAGYTGGLDACSPPTGVSAPGFFTRFPAGSALSTAATDPASASTADADATRTTVETLMWLCLMPASLMTATHRGGGHTARSDLGVEAAADFRRVLRRLRQLCRLPLPRNGRPSCRHPGWQTSACR